MTVVRSKISITLGEDLVGDVEDLVGETYDNRSEAIRELVQKGLDHDDIVDDLESTIDHLEAERDDLQRQLREVRSREDDVDEIVEYVETQQSIERRRASAGVAERAKWWLFGMDVDNQND